MRYLNFDEAERALKQHAMIMFYESPKYSDARQFILKSLSEIKKII